jgi:hypothetical protein
MNTILLTAGVVALMAAVIGGNLEALNIRIPALEGRGVRVALGALGVAFLLGALLVPEVNGDSRRRNDARLQQEAQVRHEREVEARRQQEAQAHHEREVEARYQREVEATCNAMRRATSQVTGVTGPGQTIDRDATLAEVRAGFAAATRRLQLLFDEPAPESFRREAKIAHGRAESYIREVRDDVALARATLPAYPTPEEFRAAVRPTTRSSEVVPRLEAAMTKLGGGDCSLAGS